MYRLIERNSIEDKGHEIGTYETRREADRIWQDKLLHGPQINPRIYEVYNADTGRRLAQSYSQSYYKTIHRLP